MPTVRDYFDFDFPYVLPYETEVEVELTTLSGQPVLCRFPYRTYADYNANALFLAAYMQSDEHAIGLAQSFLQHAEEIAANRPRSVLSSGREGDPLIPGNELRFTGRVFLYIDSELLEAQADAMVAVGKRNGLAPIVRCRRYAAARTRNETPVAFISYDSRDRSEVARPLALRLTVFGYPVWFDEFSLQMGESLRESIERGLRECESAFSSSRQTFLEIPAGLRLSSTRCSLVRSTKGNMSYYLYGLALRALRFMITALRSPTSTLLTGTAVSTKWFTKSERSSVHKLPANSR
jgi:hypothetical protein